VKVWRGEKTGAEGQKTRPDQTRKEEGRRKEGGRGEDLRQVDVDLLVALLAVVGFRGRLVRRLVLGAGQRGSAQDAQYEQQQGEQDMHH
jgi:hypothetical protein